MDSFGEFDMELDPQEFILWIMHTPRIQPVGPAEWVTVKLRDVERPPNQPMIFTSNGKKEIVLLNRGSSVSIPRLVKNTECQIFKVKQETLEKLQKALNPVAHLLHLDHDTIDWGVVSRKIRGKDDETKLKLTNLESRLDEKDALINNLQQEMIYLNQLIARTVSGSPLPPNPAFPSSQLNPSSSSTMQPSPFSTAQSFPPLPNFLRAPSPSAPTPIQLFTTLPPNQPLGTIHPYTAQDAQPPTTQPPFSFQSSPFSVTPSLASLNRPPRTITQSPFSSTSLNRPPIRTTIQSPPSQPPRIIIQSSPSGVDRPGSTIQPSPSLDHPRTPVQSSSPSLDHPRSTTQASPSFSSADITIPSPTDHWWSTGLTQALEGYGEEKLEINNASQEEEHPDSIWIPLDMEWYTGYKRPLEDADIPPPKSPMLDFNNLSDFAHNACAYSYSDYIWMKLSKSELIVSLSYVYGIGFFYSKFTLPASWNDANPPPTQENKMMKASRLAVTSKAFAAFVAKGRLEQYSRMYEQAMKNQANEDHPGRGKGRTGGEEWVYDSIIPTCTIGVSMPLVLLEPSKILEKIQDKNYEAYKEIFEVALTTEIKVDKSVGIIGSPIEGIGLCLPIDSILELNLGKYFIGFPIDDNKKIHRIDEYKEKGYFPVPCWINSLSMEGCLSTSKRVYENKFKIACSGLSKQLKEELQEETSLILSEQYSSFLTEMDEYTSKLYDLQFTMSIEKLNNQLLFENIQNENQALKDRLRYQHRELLALSEKQNQLVAILSNDHRFKHHFETYNENENDEEELDLDSTYSLIRDDVDLDIDEGFLLDRMKQKSIHQHSPSDSSVTRSLTISSLTPQPSTSHSTAVPTITLTGSTVATKSSIINSDDMLEQFNKLNINEGGGREGGREGEVGRGGEDSHRIREIYKENRIIVESKVRELMNSKKGEGLEKLLFANNELEERKNNLKDAIQSVKKKQRIQTKTGESGKEEHDWPESELEMEKRKKEQKDILNYKIKIKQNLILIEMIQANRLLTAKQDFIQSKPEGDINFYDIHELITKNSQLYSKFFLSMESNEIQSVFIDKLFGKFKFLLESIKKLKMISSNSSSTTVIKEIEDIFNLFVFFNGYSLMIHEFISHEHTTTHWKIYYLALFSMYQYLHRFKQFHSFKLDSHDDSFLDKKSFTFYFRYFILFFDCFLYKFPFLVNKDDTIFYSDFVSDYPIHHSHLSSYAPLFSSQIPFFTVHSTKFHQLDHKMQLSHPRVDSGRMYANNGNTKNVNQLFLVPTDPKLFDSSLRIKAKNSLLFSTLLENEAVPSFKPSGSALLSTHKSSTPFVISPRGSKSPSAPVSAPLSLSSSSWSKFIEFDDIFILQLPTLHSFQLSHFLVEFHSSFPDFLIHFSLYQPRKPAPTSLSNLFDSSKKLFSHSFSAPPSSASFPLSISVPFPSSSIYCKFFFFSLLPLSLPHYLQLSLLFPFPFPFPFPLSPFPFPLPLPLSLFPSPRSSLHCSPYSTAF